MVNKQRLTKDTKVPRHKGNKTQRYQDTKAKTQRPRHKGQPTKSQPTKSKPTKSQHTTRSAYLFRPWDPCKQFHATAAPCRSFPLPPSSPRTSNGIPNDFQSVPSVETLPNTSSTTRTPTVRTCGERESNRGISAY